ncbi:MAG: L-arabinose isomerase, partial [Anaerolineaceae bacterium]|nr:L-arabinose isomerase [Anaerolineaceae bacterium]
MMNDIHQNEIWFVTGSQHLYGPDTLRQVEENSVILVNHLNAAPAVPARIIFKGVLTSLDAIRRFSLDANAADQCVGVITWMHTFSPAKMWIAGLGSLSKPFLHLHTQFNREIPWAEIDMDFMNLNQSAHGDREFGFIGARMRLNRKVVVGYWQDADVQEEIGVWARAACGWHELRTMKLARFGDNMREVAVTEGDKVAAQIQFGFDVYGYGVGDLVDVVDQVSDAAVDDLTAEYDDLYELMPVLRKGGEAHSALREAAKIELGMRAFLENGGFTAFTTTFEDLHGLGQLPGLAVQRLMAEGYGFGGEGDWKTAALVRAMKVMASGLKGGTSFMEDYTYHLTPGSMKVLGAHMLEVCPSISAGKTKMEIHPLSIGGKADPVRLVFDSAVGPAVNASLVDMGNRFRLIVNPVDVIPQDAALPRLPVARALWIPRPNLKVAAGGWILSGGAHHTGFSMAIDQRHLADFAEMADIEYV